LSKPINSLTVGEENATKTYEQHYPQLWITQKHTLNSLLTANWQHGYQQSIAIRICLAKTDFPDSLMNK